MITKGPYGRQVQYQNQTNVSQGGTPKIPLENEGTGGIALRGRVDARAKAKAAFDPRPDSPTLGCAYEDSTKKHPRSYREYANEAEDLIEGKGERIGVEGRGNERFDLKQPMIEGADVQRYDDEQSNVIEASTDATEESK